jgi:OmpA-OmpF porin, OOP family
MVSLTILSPRFTTTILALGVAACSSAEPAPARVAEGEADAPAAPAATAESSSAAGDAPTTSVPPATAPPDAPSSPPSVSETAPMPTASATATASAGGGVPNLTAAIQFDAGAATVAAASAPQLTIIKDFLVARPDVTLLRIEVHTDSMGSDEANQRLSENRALAVAKELVQRGVGCKRLIPVGFGETQPVAPNDTPEGRQANRRTRFVVASLRGRPVGGLPVDGGGKVAGDPCR